MLRAGKCTYMWFLSNTLFQLVFLFASYFPSAYTSLGTGVLTWTGSHIVRIFPKIISGHTYSQFPIESCFSLAGNITASEHLLTLTAFLSYAPWATVLLPWVDCSSTAFYFRMTETARRDASTVPGQRCYIDGCKLNPLLL